MLRTPVPPGTAFACDKRVDDVLSNRVQPRIQRLSQIRISQRGIRTAALCVSTHDHFLDFQERDRILDYTRCVDVVGVHRVRYVAMHEYLAGLAVADGRFGDPRICAPDPEYLGRLALGEDGKGIWVARGCALLVSAVAG
jgi:hypothetical protein